MNNFICEHCNNRMKEHVEDGGKSITFYCDCRKMVPLDEVIEILKDGLAGQHYAIYEKNVLEKIRSLGKKYAHK